VRSDPICERVKAATDPGAAEGDDAGLSRLFAPFRFPTIDLTKREIAELATRNGYADLLSLSWFCGKPLRGEPCGYCTPCRLAKESGRHHEFSRLGGARDRYRRTRSFVATRIWYPVRDATSAARDRTAH
jgi:hypothetical protein